MKEVLKTIDDVLVSQSTVVAAINTIQCEYIISENEDDIIRTQIKQKMKFFPTVTQYGTRGLN